MASMWLLLCLPATVASAAGRSVWTEDAASPNRQDPTPTVSTNAPVLRWKTQVQSGGTFAYTVAVSDSQGSQVWTSGEVWQGNWPAHSPPFPGLCVYEGPPLQAGSKYTFSVRERQAADGTGKNVSTSWAAGSGSFQTSAQLPTARDELIMELQV